MDRGRVGYDAVGNHRIREERKAKSRAAHLERLGIIKRRKPGSGTLDNNPPKSMGALQVISANPRKQKMRRDEFKRVDRQNKVLLQRITRILTAPPSITDEEYRNRTIRTLKGHAYRDEQLLRMRRNAQIFDNLSRTEPYYKTAEWEEDYLRLKKWHRFMRQVHYKRPKDKKIEETGKEQNRAIRKEMRRRAKRLAQSEIGQRLIYKQEDAAGGDDEAAGVMHMSESAGMIGLGADELHGAMDGDPSQQGSNHVRRMQKMRRGQQQGTGGPGSRGSGGRASNKRYASSRTSVGASSTASGRNGVGNASKRRGRSMRRTSSNASGNMANARNSLNMSSRDGGDTANSDLVPGSSTLLPFEDWLGERYQQPVMLHVTRPIILISYPHGEMSVVSANVACLRDSDAVLRVCVRTTAEPFLVAETALRFQRARYVLEAGIQADQEGGPGSSWAISNNSDDADAAKAVAMASAAATVMGMSDGRDGRRSMRTSMSSNSVNPFAAFSSNTGAEIDSAHLSDDLKHAIAMESALRAQVVVRPCLRQSIGDEDYESLGADGSASREPSRQSRKETSRTKRAAKFEFDEEDEEFDEDDDDDALEEDEEEDDDDDDYDDDDYEDDDDDELGGLGGGVGDLYSGRSSSVPDDEERSDRDHSEFGPSGDMSLSTAGASEEEDGSAPGVTPGPSASSFLRMHQPEDKLGEKGLEGVVVLAAQDAVMAMLEIEGVREQERAVGQKRVEDLQKREYGSEATLDQICCRKGGAVARVMYAFDEEFSGIHMGSAMAVTPMASGGGNASSGNSTTNSMGGASVNDSPSPVAAGSAAGFPPMMPSTGAAPMGSAGGLEEATDEDMEAGLVPGQRLCDLCQSDQTWVVQQPKRIYCAVETTRADHDTVRVSVMPVSLSASMFSNCRRLEAIVRLPTVTITDPDLTREFVDNLAHSAKIVISNRDPESMALHL